MKQENSLTRKEDLAELDRLLLLKNILLEGTRAEYLQTLCARKKHTMYLLEKYTTIHCHP